MQSCGSIKKPSSPTLCSCSSVYNVQTKGPCRQRQGANICLSEMPATVTMDAYGCTNLLKKKLFEGCCGDPVHMSGSAVLSIAQLKMVRLRQHFFSVSSLVRCMTNVSHIQHASDPTTKAELPESIWVLGCCHSAIPDGSLAQALKLQMGVTGSSSANLGKLAMRSWRCWSESPRRIDWWLKTNQHQQTPVDNESSFVRTQAGERRNPWIDRCIYSWTKPKHSGSCSKVRTFLLPSHRGTNRQASSTRWAPQRVASHTPPCLPRTGSSPGQNRASWVSYQASVQEKSLQQVWIILDMSLFHLHR